MTLPLVFRGFTWDSLLRPILSPSWAHLVAILGPSWAHLGPSWAHLGPSWAHLGLILGLLGLILGLSWLFLGLCWAILAPLGAILGHTGAPFSYFAKLKTLRSCVSGPSASSFNLGLCGRYCWAPSVFRSCARNLRLGCFGHVRTRLEPLPSIMGFVVAVLGLLNSARRNARSG